MRILVTGSRNWTDERAVVMALHSLEIQVLRYQDITIVHGGARGADSLADMEARRRGMVVEVHRPDFNAFPGHLAPLKRNDAMLDSGIALCLAFMLGSPEKGGTLYTVRGALSRRIPVICYQWPGDPEFKED